MANWMVHMRWLQPEHGSFAFVVDLDKRELDKFQHAIDWLEDEAGDNWGDTIPAFEMTRAQDALLGGYTLQEAMKELSEQSRYREGNVYAHKYQPFEELK
jgi:hypothetical protein